MIHHISIAARHPRRAAEALAAFWQTEVLSFPMYADSYVVFVGDEYGSAIEIYPAGKVLEPSSPELPLLISTPGAAPAGHSPFHAAISVNIGEDEIMEICNQHSWFCQTGQRGSFFHVVEVWVENHTLLELLTPQMAADYVAFATLANWKKVFQSAPGA